MPVVPTSMLAPRRPMLSRMRDSLLLAALLLAPGLAFGASDLSVVSVDPAARIAPGADFTLSWTVRNLGTSAVTAAQYRVVLSADRGISLSDRQLHAGTFDLAAGAGPEEILAQMKMPADVPEGSWYVGVIVDPSNLLDEVSIGNNVGASDPILVASTSLSILTTQLPAAGLGSHWCVRLDAAGGSGVYAWSVAQGSELPPGLALQALPADAAPLATTICGRPSEVGSFDFTLEVASDGLSRSQGYSLVVSEEILPLTITTPTLPTALFRRGYSASLGAVGGKAPYGWTVVLGKLPTGLHLRADGAIVGVAEADGRFPLTLRVKDADGATADRAIDLYVSSPERLSCVTSSLGAHGIDEVVDANLAAAGGSRPFRWRTVETRRLGGTIGEAPARLGEVPPPGLVLDSSGKVTGTTKEMGHYIWTVEVSDATQARQSCMVSFVVDDDRRLTVATTSLKAAVAGQSYSARLEASGASGAVSWSLVPGSRLPAGLDLDASGLIDGAPRLEALEGEEVREFAFVVEARDSENRLALAPLALTVRASPLPLGKAEVTETSEGGCAAAGGTPSLLALIALGLAVLPRLRR